MTKARGWAAFAVVLFSASVALALGPAVKEAKPLPAALGMSTADVEAKLGKPHETASTPDGNTVWKYQEKDTRVEIAFDGGRVVKIVQAAVGDDAKEIQGTWKAVSHILDGRVEKDADAILMIGGGKITAIVGGKPEGTGQYQLDPATTPKTIKLTDPDGQVHPGIYALSGDELKLCAGRNGGAAQPKEFESKPGSDAEIAVLKRQSREWKHPAAAKPGAKEKGEVEAKGPKLVKVSGTVKFKDGSLIPVPDKQKGRPPRITFTPAPPTADAPPGQVRKGASGEIKEDGTFAMATIRPGDGVIPGKYTVIIVAYSKYAPEPGSSLVPLKYTSPQTSGLEITIDKPTSDIKLELDKP